MSKNIYVGNLSYDSTEDRLRSLFAEYGEVPSAKVITDRYIGRPRSFAFVEMSTEEAAQAAISALNGQTVDGRQTPSGFGQTPPRSRPQPERRGPIAVVNTSPAVTLPS